jgi:hypothetical protein
MNFVEGSSLTKQQVACKMIHSRKDELKARQQLDAYLDRAAGIY